MKYSAKLDISNKEFLMALAQTQRLIIRQVREDDWSFMLTLLNEKCFIDNITDKNVKTEEQAKAFIKESAFDSYAKYGFGPYLVALKDSEIAVGICGFYQREVFDLPDLGYAFLSEYHGKGYAKEAALATLELGNSHCRLNKVLAITKPENLSSNKLLTKVGFDLIDQVELYDVINNLYEIELN